MDKYYTVEQVAELLTMHPKTIQRYIREGKLRASKVGKSWRVSGHDLSVFTENIGLTGQATLESAQDRINISCVVDILTDRTDEGIGIVNLLTAAMNCKPENMGSLLCIRSIWNTKAKFALLCGDNFHLCRKCWISLPS